MIAPLRHRTFRLLFSGQLVSNLGDWLDYLALEPFVRRRWPEAMISWTRLLGGRFADPLVARDILIGCAAGCAHCPAPAR